MESRDKMHDPLVRLGRMIEVRKRITALIPDHSEILNMGNKPLYLFKIPGFDIGDLEVTDLEVEHALTTAITQWNEKHGKQVRS